MTDITLEQRADRLFDAMMAAPYGSACIGDVVCAETTASRLRAAWLPLIEAALRLSAGADWVLVPLDAVTAAATELTFADREGAAADLLNAMLAAAPKPEDS